MSLESRTHRIELNRNIEKEIDTFNSILLQIMSCLELSILFMQFFSTWILFYDSNSDKKAVCMHSDEKLSRNGKLQSTHYSQTFFKLV